MGRIAFIDGGNMAAAIVGGLTEKGTAPIEIAIVDPNADQRARMLANFHVAVSDDVAGSYEAADTIILAVKPQVTPVVARQIGTDIGGEAGHQHRR